jgi:hypothetical protein
MTKHLIAVSDSTNTVMIQYIDSQLEAISKTFPELTVEHVNENSDVMKQYARYPNRLPAFFIFKNDVKKCVLQAKIDTPELINWVSKNIG